VESGADDLPLRTVATDVLAALVAIDTSGKPFRNYQPGVGPYGEPQLVRLVAEYLNALPRYDGKARTQRTPDLLIPSRWAIEFKITRPFGDNGKEAENWSVNLLHPYPGNVSSIGDCLKLLALEVAAKKAVIVVGYEHVSPMIDVLPLIRSFEVIAREVVGVLLSERIEVRSDGLIHPVHQVIRLFAWEVLGSTNL
jgi:hypothetical protein